MIRLFQTFCHCDHLLVNQYNRRFDAAAMADLFDDMLDYFDKPPVINLSNIEPLNKKTIKILIDNLKIQGKMDGNLIHKNRNIEDIEAIVKKLMNSIDRFNNRLQS